MSKWQWQQAIGFQIFWLCSVWGGNSWLALATLLLVCHFIFTPSRKQDAYVCALALVGMSVDAALTALGVFEFNHTPVWLAFLWLGFTLTLGHSLSWLRALPVVVQTLLGAVSGTCAYMGAYRFNAVNLPLGLWLSILIIAVIWALLLPSLIKADLKVRGVE